MKLRCLFYLLVPVCFAASVGKQNNFVYVNDDVIPNTVSGFAVGEDGALTAVPGSPFPTGGNGAGTGDFRYFASNRIRVVGNFLYASNHRSNNVSGFVIDPDTGTLAPVPGSPFATGGLTGTGLSLATTPDGRFLYTGNDGSQNITVFSIGSEGELIPIGDRVPLGNGVHSMTVSPDGRWLAVAQGYVGEHGSVAIFSIDPETGDLTPVKGSPFLVREPGGRQGVAAGLDINCASDTLYVGEGGVTMDTAIVDVLSIDPKTGTLTAIDGSPFMPGVGYNSNVPLLSPDDSLLFVSNQGNGVSGDPSNAITAFTVAEDRALTVVEGSPFPIGYPAVHPTGMATDQAGSFLYVTGFDDYLGVFSIDPSGTLTAVPGSPFGAGDAPGVLSLVAFPPKTCSAGQ